MADETDEVEQGNDTEAGPQDAAHLQAPTRRQAPARGLSGARDTVWTRAMTRAKKLASCLVPRGGAKDPEDDLTDGEMARLLAQEELHRSDEIHDKAQGGMQADTRSDTYTGKSQTQQAATGTATEAEAMQATRHGPQKE